jgi:NADPH2:quinone reductase
VIATFHYYCSTVLYQLAMQICATMLAIKVTEWGGPTVLRASTAEVPTPGRGEVLVRVLAAGVNPVETYIRAGTYARKPELPWTPGNDGAGIVEAVGPETSGAPAVGARVWLSGTLSGSYAQFALASASDVHALPAALSFEEGACVGVAYRTAYRAIFLLGKARSGDFVLVHGATGGVGVAAVQLAARHGCVVIGSSSTERGRAAVLANGATHAIAHGDVAALLEITEGKGAALIVEMLGDANLGVDCAMVAQGGTVAVVGNRGAATINARELMMREASIVGVMLARSSAEEAKAALAALGAGLADGTLRPVVGPVFPLARAAEAHIDVLEHRGGASGKVVIQTWSEEAAVAE